MFKLVKLGLIVVGILAIMYLYGSGQMESFMSFARGVFSGL